MTQTPDFFASIELSNPAPTGNAVDCAICHGPTEACANGCVSFNALPIELGDAPSADTVAALADLAPAAIASVATLGENIGNVGPTATAGSVRSSGFVAPESTGNAFDSSPLTAEEIASRDANRARSAAHHARMAALNVPTAIPTPVEPTPVETPLFGTGIAVETGLITDTRIGTIFSQGPTTITGYSVARAKIEERIVQGGFDRKLAPGVKSSKAQFGRIMRNTHAWAADRLLVRAVDRADTARLQLEWPDNLVSRYLVGLVDGSPELGRLGDKLLVADLVTAEDGGTEIRFNGGSDMMRAKILARFEQENGAEILTSTDLRNWYRRIMRTEFGALEYGGMLLVLGTGEASDKAKALTDCITDGGLMGRDIAYVTQSDRNSVGWTEFCKIQGKGLVNEVTTMRERFALALKLAQARDVKAELAKLPEESSEHDRAACADLATRRAMILDRAARTLYADLQKIQEKCSGMKAAIGSANTKPAVAACVALWAEYSPKCEGVDDTSTMASMLELD